MGKINILTKEIFNRIAAGEVVDRPYSAVKELIENALDAGATEISVYVEKGGRQLIRVCDNGGGIEPDDMRKAFIPHATSKVAKVEELIAEKPKGEMLAFVGDGINDAPVLSRADVGIAMGAMGSDAAIEAADVVLMDDDPMKISKAICISKKCLSLIHI